MEAAAAVVGGAETLPPAVAALWSACARRLLQIARGASSSSSASAERLGAGSVARAAWALAEGGGSGGAGGQQQRRQRRALGRALAGRANVLLALTLKLRPDEVAPQLLMTAKDAEVMTSAFARLKEMWEEEERVGEDGERGRSALRPPRRGGGDDRSLSLSRSRSRRCAAAVFDSAAFWTRLEEVGSMRYGG
jgi:hypothetical protein